MKKEYVPRLFDDILDFSLQCKGAVLVVGPKWWEKQLHVRDMLKQ